jgi:hypothetical protein
MSVKKIRRRVSVRKTLYFDYEISPYRAFLEKIAGTENINKTAALSAHSASDSVVATQPGASSPQSLPKVTAGAGADKLGDYVPFRQSRLKGQSNPLRPPFHVETVLIGRALGQPTGYLLGIGFRIRDDGYVEAEFNEGITKYDTYEEFKADIIVRMFGRPGR